MSSFRYTDVLFRDFTTWFVHELLVTLRHYYLRLGLSTHLPTVRSSPFFTEERNIPSKTYKFPPYLSLHVRYYEEPVGSSVSPFETLRVVETVTLYDTLPVPFLPPQQKVVSN